MSSRPAHQLLPLEGASRPSILPAGIIEEMLEGKTDDHCLALLEEYDDINERARNFLRTTT